jgi:hypothetical protein
VSRLGGDGYVTALVGAALGTALGVGWLTYSTSEVSAHPHTFDNFQYLLPDIGALVLILVGGPIGCGAALGRTGRRAAALTAMLVLPVGMATAGVCGYIAWMTGQRAATPWNLVEYAVALTVTVGVSRLLALAIRPASGEQSART